MESLQGPTPTQSYRLLLLPGMSPFVSCSMKNGQPWNYICIKNKNRLHRLYIERFLYTYTYTHIREREREREREAINMRVKRAWERFEGRNWEGSEGQKIWGSDVIPFQLKTLKKKKKNFWRDYHTWFQVTLKSCSNKILQSNETRKQENITILISDKVDSKLKVIRRDLKFFILIKGTVN